MQSFYSNFVVKVEEPLEAQPPVGYSSGGSRSSSCPPSRLQADAARGQQQRSFYHDSFWAKPRFVPPPIFRAPGKRSDEALAMDRQLRSADTLHALMALVAPCIARFDVGNVVIALASCARVVDERTLPTLKFGYPAFPALQARAEESVTALEPRGLAMLAHSAAKLGWKDIGVLTAVASCAGAKAPDLTSTDLAKICWAFSKLDVVDELPSFWQTMAENVRAKACTAKSVDLSMLAWAFGNCGQGDAGLCCEMAKAALQLMSELTPQCLANIAWAMARLAEPHEELFAAIIARSLTSIADFVDFDVTHLCWALAKLNCADAELFDMLADHTVNHGFVRRFSAQMTSQLAWAFAAARVVHRPLFAQLANFVARHASVLESQHLANCAWAFASVEWTDPGLVGALAHACKGGKLWTFAPDEFCAIAWAFGKFRMADAEIRSDLLLISRQRCDELDNVSFVNLLTSLLTMVGSSGSAHGEAEKDRNWRESGRPLVEQLEESLAKRQDLTPQQMAATCRSLCRAGFQQEAHRIAKGSAEPDVLAALLAAAERAGDAPRCVELWSRLASAMPALALRAAALFCAGRWARDANLPDGRLLIDELSNLPEPFAALGELLGGAPTAPTRATGEVNGAAHTEGYGEFAELGGLLAAALRSGSPGNPALCLGAVESFAASCRYLNAFLGARAAILDEFTARLPQLVVEIGGGCGAWAAHLAARVQEYGGRVVSIESDPIYMAVSRCIAHYAGLSSSLQLLLGESLDCLPQLLEARGPSSVDVLVLRGNRESQYLCELRRVEDMGLFTSGCVVADHMLQFGSPQFLADMAREPKYSLDLVEVETVGGGTDWVALCAVRARLQDDPRAERELPAGLASLRAAAEQAWRRQRDGDVSRAGFATPERFQERLVDFARNLGLQPSQRFRGIAPAPLPERSKEAVHQLSSLPGLPPTEISLPQQEIRSDAKAPAPEPGMGAASRSPVAQQYVLALDLKRWLNAVDPTGGCLHYLAAVQERHETSEHLTKAYVQESSGRCMLKAEFFSDLAISAEHRPRFLRWFTDSCGVEGVLGVEASDVAAEAPALPCSQAAAKEDAFVDLRHLSFSDWLASMDPGMALQRYLPAIQESYDTVSQITTTYTTASTAESDLKCLDEQMFEDFGIEESEHRALFRSWFVRFCGVRPADADGEEDPATPHFGPEGEEGKEPGTADQSDAPEAAQEPKQVGEISEKAPQAPAGGSGGFFDFEDLPESSPTSTAQPEPREEDDASTAVGTQGAVENVQQQDSSGMFDFDQLDSVQGLGDNSASSDPDDAKAAEVVPAAADSVQQVAHHLRPSAQPYIASRLRQAPDPEAAASAAEGREEARAAIEILARGMGKLRQAGAMSRLRVFQRLKEARHDTDASAAAEGQQEVAHHLRPSAQPHIPSRLRRAVADSPTPNETRPVQVEAPQDVVAGELGHEDASQDTVVAAECGENEAGRASEDEQEVKPSGGGFFDFDDLDEAGG